MIEKNGIHRTGAAVTQNSGAFFAGEDLTDLGGGLSLIQRKDGYRFSVDALLLARFLQGRDGWRAAEIGCGSGVISILAHRRFPGMRVDLVESDAGAAALASRNVALNGLTEALRVHRVAARDAPSLLGPGSMDLVFFNPPYWREAARSRVPEKATAMHQEPDTLEEFLRCARELLRGRGRVCMVYPSFRLPELLRALAAAQLQPKRARLVQHSPRHAPRRVLVEAMKSAREGLAWEPTLMIEGEN